MFREFLNYLPVIFTARNLLSRSSHRGRSESESPSGSEGLIVGPVEIDALMEMDRSMFLHSALPSFFPAILMICRLCSIIVTQ